MRSIVVSVILPTYNERENIVGIIRHIRAELRDVEHEIIVIDDNSPDGTYAELKGDPTVRAFLRTTERGLASAVDFGFQQAQGDYVVVMDADGQHPPEAIRRMLDSALATDAAIVVASRGAAGSSQHDFSFMRRAISRTAAGIARALLPRLRSQKVSDPMSGFFLIRRRSLTSFDRRPPPGFKILLQILARSGNERVAEVPFQFGRRQRGSSKLDARVVTSYLRQLLTLAWLDPDNRTLIRFAIVGASGAVVNLGLIAAATHALPASVLAMTIASIIAREIAILWNFSWAETVVFNSKPRRSGLARRLWRWHMITGAATVLYIVVAATLIPMGLHPLAAGTVAILAGAALNWIGAKHWAYASADAERNIEAS